MTCARYADGRDIRAGDIIEEEGVYRARVLVAIASQEAVEGYVAAEWTYLREGIVVEYEAPTGPLVVHLPTVDKRFVLECRATDSH